MTDYTKLVEALRCCILNSPETCVGCTYNIGNNECNVKRIVVDAAAAIEALQAQLPKRGKWIVHTEVKNIYGGICIECPVCRDHFVVLNVSDEKYCRSCGAKMEVQEC